MKVTVQNDVPDGIEWRSIKYQDGYLLNLVNYNKDAKEITLNKRVAVPGGSLDLITHEPVKDTFVLEPMKPMLIRMRVQK